MHPLHAGSSKTTPYMNPVPPSTFYGSTVLSPTHSTQPIDPVIDPVLLDTSANDMPCPPLVQLGGSAPKSCRTHQEFSSHDLDQLLGSVIRVNPFMALHTKIGDQWKEVTHIVQEKGFCQTCDPDTLKNKVSSMLAWVEVSQPLSGDDLFSAPKLSQSSTNSNLRHLQHSSDSDCLRVPETLQGPSYSEPLPVGPNTTAHSFHSNLLPDTPSEGCSETSASSESNPKTSSDSTPSNLNSALTFFGYSLSHDRVRATPAASDIKGQIIKAICDVKGRWWAGSMGNAGRWP